MLWQVDAAVLDNSLVVASNYVLGGSPDGKLHVIDASGRDKPVKLGTWIGPVSADGDAVYAVVQGKLTKYALSDIQSGVSRPIWSTPVDRSTTALSKPAFGRIITSSLSTSTSVDTQSGAVKLRFNAGSGVARPTLLSQTRVLCCSSPMNLIELDEDQRKVRSVWSCNIFSPAVYARPVQRDDGWYATSGLLYKFDIATGRKLWASDFAGVSQPGFVGDKVLVALQHGVACLDSKTGYPAWYSDFTKLVSPRLGLSVMSNPIALGGNRWLAVGTSLSSWFVGDLDSGHVVSSGQLGSPSGVNHEVYVQSDGTLVTAGQKIVGFKVTRD